MLVEGQGGSHSRTCALTVIGIIQDGTDRREAKVFRAHAAPSGVYDNLVNALNQVLANPQRGADNSPSEVLVKGLQERRRIKMTDGLRKFVTMDNHEAVKIGD